MIESTGGIEQYVSMALASDGFRILYRTGGGIVMFGFLLNLLLEWVKFYQGQKADWSAPIITVFMTASSLALFPIIIQMVIGFGGTFGDLEQGSKYASEVFQKRIDKFVLEMQDGQATPKEGSRIQYMAEHHGEMPPEDSSRDNSFFGSFANGVKASFLYYVTLLLQYITIALVTALKVIQGLVLRVLVFLGPVMIAMGVLPGPFKRLPMNWFMLFFSISFWSVVMNALLRMLAESTIAITPGAINLSEEIIISITWIFLIMSVPPLTSALIYGGGFSGVFSETAGVVGGAVKGGAAFRLLSKLKGG